MFRVYVFQDSRFNISNALPRGMQSKSPVPVIAQAVPILQSRTIQYTDKLSRLSHIICF